MPRLSDLDISETFIKGDAVYSKGNGVMMVAGRFVVSCFYLGFVWNDKFIESDSMDVHPIFQSEEVERYAIPNN